MLKKLNTMSTKISIYRFPSIVYCLLFIVYCFPFVACHESLEDRAERTCREETHRNCPQRLGGEMVMDSITFDRATRTIVHHVTLSGHLDTVTTAMKTSLGANILKELQNQTGNKIFKDAAINFRYTFNSQRNGDILYDFTFKKEDYY